jgi:hypothetical protein
MQSRFAVWIRSLGEVAASVAVRFVNVAKKFRINARRSRTWIGESTTVRYVALGLLTRFKECVGCYCSE